MLTLPLLLGQFAEGVEPADPGGSFDWVFLFNPAVVWVLIPIVAILAGSIAKIIQRSQEHRERMAMIAAGLHPDYPPEEVSDTAEEARDAERI